MESLWETLRNNGIYPGGEEPDEGEAKAIDDGAELLAEQEKAAIATKPEVVLPVSEEERTTGDSGLFVLESQQAAPARQTQTRKRDFSAKDLQTAILKVLENRPNQSIATKSLTQAVCKQLSIITRGQPRMELDKRIRRSLGVLKRKDLVQEYKAKNVRVRLVAN